MTMNLPAALLPYERKAWKPIVENRDGAANASKFSGVPYLAKGEEYPVCPNCGKPSQLFVQLNLDELPEALQGEYGSGLLQMFYCINEEPMCEVDCEAFFPFAKSVVVRIVEPEGDVSSINEVTLDNPFPPKVIAGWEEMEDYPNREEGKSLGIVLEAGEWDILYDEDLPRNGDKLAGYPLWVQGIEYPNCPVCDKKMRLVFQIDSEDNVPFMFGDAGCGHITQCETHKDQLAFGWACG